MTTKQAALTILARSGVPAIMPPERLHKYSGVVLSVKNIITGEHDVLFGDVVTHLSLNDWAELAQVKIMQQPGWVGVACPGEKTDLA